MADRSRSRRSPTRYLAPLALVAVIAGTYLVAHHVLDKTTPHRSPPVSHAAKKAKPGHPAARPRHAAAAKVYVVKSGDSLSTISAATGVSLPKLEELNPGIASNALQVGERLKLSK
jgi:LysM repeat protein